MNRWWLSRQRSFQEWRQCILFPYVIIMTAVDMNSGFRCCFFVWNRRTIKRCLHYNIDRGKTRSMMLHRRPKTWSIEILNVSTLVRYCVNFPCIILFATNIEVSKFQYSWYPKCDLYSISNRLTYANIILYVYSTRKRLRHLQLHVLYTPLLQIRGKNKYT